MLIVWDGRVATNRSHVKVTHMIGTIGSPKRSFRFWRTTELGNFGSLGNNVFEGLLYE